MEKIQLNYRTWFKGQPPQRVKAKIPGWVGDSNRHDNGTVVQPWHCTPFMEGSTYGLELIYPFDTECRVSMSKGKPVFEGDFSKEAPWSMDGRLPVGAPPFMNFVEGHYGFTSSLDLEPPEGYVLRIEPHPRYYTDKTGDVPLAIVGHIQRWWSRIFFVVFKNPWPGQTHVFRKGEPYAQLLLVPSKVDYDIRLFEGKELEKRRWRDSVIANNGGRICKRAYTSSEGHVFDDKYKQMARIYAKGGYEALDSVLSDVMAQKQKEYEESLKPRKPIGHLVRKRRDNASLPNQKDREGQ